MTIEVDSHENFGLQALKSLKISKINKEVKDIHALTGI